MPAQFLAQFLRRLILIVLDDDFDKQIGPHYVLRFILHVGFYTEDVNCVICNIRKPRRHCPGVNGEICSICCGTEREQTIDCPLECPWLRAAHEHERPPDLDPASIPNQDITVTEEFLRSNEVVMAFIAMALFEGAMKQQGATDWDMRDALEALVKTYRTAESGLIYETVPDNKFAAAIAANVREKLADLVKRETEARGASSLRDADVLGVLVFIQRLEISRNNGRKRSRSFLDFLGGFYSPASAGGEQSEIMEPDAPRVIL